MHRYEEPSEMLTDLEVAHPLCLDTSGMSLTNKEMGGVPTCLSLVRPLVVSVRSGLMVWTGAPGLRGRGRRRQRSALSLRAYVVCVGAVSWDHGSPPTVETVQGSPQATPVGERPLQMIDILGTGK